MKEVAERHLGASFIAVLEKNIGIGVPAHEKKKKKRGRKIKSGTVVKPIDLDQQVPSSSTTQEYDDPFANIRMYGSDTDPDNDSVEPDFVINDVVSNSSIVKPIPNPPLK